MKEIKEKKNLTIPFNSDSDSNLGQGKAQN